MEMLKYQKDLNSLPVPNLEETLEKYLEWVKPILTEEEFDKTKSIVEEFGDQGNEGEKLHNKLIGYKNNVTDNNSWLFPLWDEMYLGGRGSIIPDISFCVLLNNDKYKEKYTISQILGIVANSSTKIYHEIVDGTLNIDSIKGNPLCMEQYLRVFRGMRIPNVSMDELYVGDMKKDNNYCILFNKNKIYKIMLTNMHGEIVSAESISKSIQLIIDKGVEGECNPFLYTSTDREKAKVLLDEILISDVNVDSFNQVKDALFAMCIDETTNSPKESIRDILISKGDNRCFDKGIQFIINQDKELGVNGEHTGFDGTTAFAIFEMINKVLDTVELDKEENMVFEDCDTLDFEISEKANEIMKEVRAEQEFKYNDYKFYLEYFEEFGKNKIKELKVSPDAYFHIALQLAQYKTFSFMKSTYEAVAVRSFRQGRTECARSSSLEKLEFAKAYVNGESNEVLFDLLQKASKAHISRIGECQRGHGVERHLFGLYNMQAIFGEELNINNIPELFNDKGYKSLKNDFLSTSGVGGEFVRYCAFGPQTEEGYGIFYTINNDNIAINMSSKMLEESKGIEFIENIKQSFRDIKDLIEEYNAK